MAEETVVEDVVAEETVVEVKIDTTNPFNKGVSYEDFLSNVKGNKTIDSMLKKHKIDEDSCKWIKEELKQYKQNNKK